MAVHSNTLTPAFAIHPGEMLKDELEVRGITQKEFAQLTGIPQTLLNEIIKGKRGIYADTALVIGKALQMDAILWTNLQMHYELDLAKINEKNKARLESIDIWQMIHEYIPVKFFKKEGVLTGNPLTDIPVVKQIYQIDNVEQLASLYSQNGYARFRKSDQLSIDKVNLIGWVKLVNYKASQSKVGKFNSRNQEELIQGLNEIFRKNKKVIEKTTSLLAVYGIKLIFQSHPEKCAVDGISFWSTGNPAIGLTMRHKRIDNFAFTIMHELGHIFLHLVNNNEAQFIDLDKDHSDKEYINSIEEKEANEFARNALINEQKWKEFMEENPFFEEAAVLVFASRNKINPAIVQGRFMYETEYFNIRSSINKLIG